jgi:hypothetical protein
VGRDAGRQVKTVQSETEIKAPPSRVWAILSDFSSYPQWNPFIKRIQGDAEPGKRLEVRIQAPGAKGMTFRPTVLAATPDKELRWLGHLLIPRLFDGEHQLLISQLGDQRIRFTQREVFRGLLVPFTGGILAKTEQGFVAMNEALKKRAEGNA